MKVLNQDYLTMIKGWLAYAEVNPVQGFMKGIAAVAGIFTGQKNLLGDYVTRVGQINDEFNKTKKIADDSQQVYDSYSRMLERVEKDLDALGEGSDKYAAALAKENKQIDEGNALIDLAQQAYAKHKITRDQLNDAIDKGNALIDLANQHYQETTSILDL